jgi:hypothetical protein
VNGSGEVPRLRGHIAMACTQNPRRPPIVWILCAFDAKLKALGGLWEFLENQYDRMLWGEVEALGGTWGHLGTIWG